MVSGGAQKSKGKREIKKNLIWRPLPPLVNTWKNAYNRRDSAEKQSAFGMLNYMKISMEVMKYHKEGPACGRIPYDPTSSEADCEYPL